MNILDEIVKKKKKVEVRTLRNRKVYSLSEKIKEKNNEGKIALIAEIKPKSPSFGEFESENILNLAKIYENNGASSISILTEYNYFGGNIDYLYNISKEVNIPILRKDFISNLDEIQDSFNLGADVVLLIVALLGNKLKDYLNECYKLGIEALSEVHNKNELDIALNSGAKIIGINNRDLKTLEVNLDTTKELSQFIDNSKILVSESGIENTSNISNLAQYGVDAVLVGTKLMQSKKKDQEVRKLSNVRIND